MLKQDWMIIVAGEDLVDVMTDEQKKRVPQTGFGYASDALSALQRDRASRGILGAEIVRSAYGNSVRYDSGLQNFGLLAGSRCGMLDGSLEHAVRWAKEWVAKDPTHRYAWMRKTESERNLTTEN